MIPLYYSLYVKAISIISTLYNGIHIYKNINMLLDDLNMVITHLKACSFLKVILQLTHR